MTRDTRSKKVWIRGNKALNRGVEEVLVEVFDRR